MDSQVNVSITFLASLKIELKIKEFNIARKFYYLLKNELLH